MTEICFQRCTSNFNYRNLTMDEVRTSEQIRTNQSRSGTICPDGTWQLPFSLREGNILCVRWGGNLDAFWLLLPIIASCYSHTGSLRLWKSLEKSLNLKNVFSWLVKWWWYPQSYGKAMENFKIFLICEKGKRLRYFYLTEICSRIILGHQAAVALRLCPLMTE